MTRCGTGVPGVPGLTCVLPGGNGFRLRTLPKPTRTTPEKPPGSATPAFATLLNK